MLPRAALAAWMLLASCLSAAALPETLYRAEVIVTGVEEPERSRGFREGLEEIIVKLTGCPDLAGQPVLDPILSRAHEFVASYSYEDRMKHLPIRDEQGTRDRPHYLRFEADRVKLGSALRDAGLRLWNAPRPRVGIKLIVTDFIGTFTVPDEGSRGYEQREVLKSIARRRGIEIVLPDANGQFASAPTHRLEGTLTLHQEGGWLLEWAVGAAHLPAGQNRLRAESFDTALRQSFDRWIESLSGCRPN